MDISGHLVCQSRVDWFRMRPETPVCLVSHPVTNPWNHLKTAARSRRKSKYASAYKATVRIVLKNCTVFQNNFYVRLRFCVGGLYNVFKYTTVVGYRDQCCYSIVSRTYCYCNRWLPVSKLTNTEDVHLCCHRHSLRWANAESISIKGDIHLWFKRNNWQIPIMLLLAKWITGTESP